jgi:hypothetical protein
MSENINKMREMSKQADEIVENYKKVTEALSSAPFPLNIITAYVADKQSQHLGEESIREKNHTILKNLTKKTGQNKTIK